MNIFRLTAVAVSLTLFSACGGGGGGGGAGGGGAGGGGGGGGGGVALEPLPRFLVNRVDARQSVTGFGPLEMTEEQIEAALESRAGAANRLLANGIVSAGGGRRLVASFGCQDRTCIVSYEGRNLSEFSLDDLGDIPRENVDIGGQDLVGFDSESEAVMTDGDVTLVQGRAAGRFAAGGSGSYQTYGGWLEGSVFAVEIGKTTGSTPEHTPGTVHTSYSFGNRDGNNPTPGTVATATWNGVMIGATATEDVVHGAAVVDIDNLNTPDVDVLFTSIVNLSAGGNVLEDMEWMNIPLRDGAFSSDVPGSIEGVFYGAGHEEVGGVFYHRDIVGAFGATR